MKKIPIKSLKNSSTVLRNNKSNVHYFEITSLSFKIRTEIGVCTLVKPYATFQSFLLEILLSEHHLSDTAFFKISLL